MVLYKIIIRPLLFLCAAEQAHEFVFYFLKKRWFQRVLAYFFKSAPSNKPVSFLGLTFKNPVGLAAGFDKNAVAIDAFAAMGFGFVEIGTVTPVAQPGNDKPRLFRLTKDQALINRMGFNNQGLDAVIENLKKRKSKIVVGGNIGKNKWTPNEQAEQDYLTCLERLYTYVDYFVVNVSSPNTPDLRALQDKVPLTKLFTALQERRAELSKVKQLPIKPILLKIAPDLSFAQIDDVIEICTLLHIDGLVISNTTVDRSVLLTKPEIIQKIGSGGLSGKPLNVKSTEILDYIHGKIPHMPIIGVGGVHSGQDAIAKKEAGASLVQLYTGFVYQGPELIYDILRLWND